MKSAKIALAAAALLLATTPLAAQIRVHVTPFYGYVLPQGNLPESFAVTDVAGTSTDIPGGEFESKTAVYGGMLAVRLWGPLSVEGTILTGKDQLSATRRDPTDVTILAYSGGISLELPRQWRVAPFLVAGAGVKSYDFDMPGAQSKENYEYNFGAGLDLELSRNLALNLQARDMYSTFTSGLYGVKNEIQNDLFVAAGLSIKFGFGTSSGVATLMK